MRPRRIGARVPALPLGWEIAATPPPPGFEEIQRQVLSRLFGRMVGIRLLVIPAGLILVGYVAFAEPARWRLWVLLALLTPAFVFFVAELLRFRRRGFTPTSLEANLSAILLIQLGLSFATGALESPFVYTTLPLAFITGIFARPRGRLALISIHVLGLWGLALLEVAGWIPDLNPVLFGGGPRAGHVDAHLYATAVLLTGVSILGSQASSGIRAAFDAMLRRAIEAQREILRAHGERAEELTALSGEIAHELKNPLASVKGLAALLEEAVAEGKPHERLRVLRREVDRMQDILEEFLNFSRPLIPLNVTQVELLELATEVAMLHEGLANERRVRLEVKGEPVPARCDPRKVKQVLINLVQNAIEASLPQADAEIEIEIARERGWPVVRVLDRGPGLAETVRERVFEPGVTSKPRGSGLGLTIARALARQHGGEVSLEPRDGGGAVASLLLPEPELPRPGVAA